MFVLDTWDQLQHRRATNRTTLLTLEAWHHDGSKVTHGLALHDNGYLSFEFLREQLLVGGVFKGLHCPAALPSEYRPRLEGLGIEPGCLLFDNGAGGIVNIDATVTVNDLVYPGIVINLRFSPATYFSRYIAAGPSQGRVQVRCYDLSGVTDIGRLPKDTDALAAASSVRATVASISDACAKGHTRIFLPIDAAAPVEIEGFKQSWLQAVKRALSAMVHDVATMPGRMDDRHGLVTPVGPGACDLSPPQSGPARISP